MTHVRQSSRRAEAGCGRLLYGSAAHFPGCGEDTHAKKNDSRRIH